MNNASLKTMNDRIIVVIYSFNEAFSYILTRWKRVFKYDTSKV